MGESDGLAESVVVRDLHRGEVEAAVGVLARGMRDNPLHVAAYGADPEQRARRHAILVRGVLNVFDDGTPICAVKCGRLVGVTGVAPAGTCQPSAKQRVRMARTLISLGPRSAGRVLAWTSAWARHDPEEPHAHLGPLSVEAALQGQGIGSLIMREYCHRLDGDAMVGYLETDKVENVTFYRRFGFEVVGEARVLGVPNWFMRRAVT